MNDIFKTNSNQKKRLFVVDDFYTNPLAIREHALAQTYFQGEGAVGERTREQFLFDGLKEKFEDIVVQIEPYYIPCKASRFLYDLNEGKQITILRHLLRAIGYDLLVQEKVLHNIKSTTYQIFHLIP